MNKHERPNSPPLNGLVLVGGRSRRMGQDKAALHLHGRSQAAHTHALLTPFCAEVYISKRADQELEEADRHLPTVDDAYPDAGPANGILSAFGSTPECAWLVLACDLPFVTEGTIATLIEHRDPSRGATCFRSATDGLPEPLCAIYEPACQAEFEAWVMAGKRCPRKFLINGDTHMLDQDDPRWLDNINQPEDLVRAQEALSHRPTKEK